MLLLVKGLETPFESPPCDATLSQPHGLCLAFLTGTL